MSLRNKNKLHFAPRFLESFKWTCGVTFDWFEYHRPIISNFSLVPSRLRFFGCDVACLHSVSSFLCSLGYGANWPGDEVEVTFVNSFVQSNHSRSQISSGLNLEPILPSRYFDLMQKLTHLARSINLLIGEKVCKNKQNSGLTVDTNT